MASNNNKRQEIRTEQVRLIYEHAPRAIPFQVVTASIVVVAVWSHIPALWLCTWWLALSSLSVYRYWRARRSMEAAHWSDQSTALCTDFCVGVGATGALWGLGYLLFAAFLPVDYQTLVILVLAGIGSGGLIASYGIKSHFYSFIFPALGTPTAYGLYQGTPLQLWVSLLLVVFITALLLSFARYATAVRDLIETRLENAQLVGVLSESNRELEEANTQLLALSSTDGLTQIANRRHFDDQLQREWARAQRSGNVLSYIMVDIDFFKPYNDHYGHLQGDDCLKTVAQAIENTLRRPGDFLGRYGGEEFAILAPGTSLDGAVLLAENIRAAIEGLEISHAGSAVSAHVTVSVGVASIRPHPAASPDSLIRAADQALYVAKRNGRNRVTKGPDLGEASAQTTTTSRVPGA